MRTGQGIIPLARRENSSLIVRAVAASGGGGGGGGVNEGAAGLGAAALDSVSWMGGGSVKADLRAVTYNE